MALALAMALAMAVALAMAMAMALALALALAMVMAMAMAMAMAVAMAMAMAMAMALVMAMAVENIRKFWSECNTRDFRKFILYKGDEMNNCECPYCEHGFDLDMEYAEAQDEDFSIECPECEKTFVVYTDYDITFPSRKADCLNTNTHIWEIKRVHDFAYWEYGTERCKECQKERIVDELKLKRINNVLSNENRKNEFSETQVNWMFQQRESIEARLKNNND